MDGQRFDDLARWAVKRGRSRRGVLRGLAGGALAALLGGAAVSPQGAAAKCLQPGKACKRDNQCCSDVCRRRKCRPTRPQGTCRVGEDRCQQGSGFAYCNNTTSCGCYVTMSGALFCGSRFDSTCYLCTSDEECRIPTGPGSRCVQVAGTPYCPGCAFTGTVCIAPCPQDPND